MSWVVPTTDTQNTINNTLISTSTTESLSANQGKVLKDLLDSLDPVWNTVTLFSTAFTTGGDATIRWRKIGDFYEAFISIKNPELASGFEQVGSDSTINTTLGSGFEPVFHMGCGSKSAQIMLNNDGRIFSYTVGGVSLTGSEPFDMCHGYSKSFPVRFH